MKTLTTDVVILGAGTAGLNARREAERAGRRWLLVDPGPYGTTCARVGCMPSKLLIAAADAAEEVRHAHRFGIGAQDPTVHGRAVMQRVKAERDRFAGFVVRDTEALPADQRLKGRGRLAGPHTVIVDDHTRIETGSVVIATGSSPWTPPGLEQVTDHVLVNDDLFDLDDLPASMAVLGAGIIGLELGQALRRLDVDVHLFDPFEVLGGLDDPAVLEVAKATIGAGLPLHLGSQVTEAVPDAGGVRLTWTEADGSTHSRRFDKILAAAGRRPNLAGLGLDTLGVPLDRRGMPPYDPYTTQVGELPVFLAGDVNGDRPLLHEAGDEGRIAGANAASFPRVNHGHRRVPLAIAFTDPQIGFVGRRYTDLHTAPCFAVGQVSYADQGRARVMGKNAGLVRIYADARTTRITGATMFGPRVEHTAHLLAWAIADDLTVTEALQRPFYHPVIEEGIRTALHDLAASLKVTNRCAPEDMAEGPGA